MIRIKDILRRIIKFFHRVINNLRRNMLKKFIALVVAFFMWVFVMDDQDPQIEGTYTVSLTISNTPYNFVAVCDDKTVKIDVLAPRSYFTRYDANAFRAYANVENMNEGTHEIIPQIVMPQGFELSETNPSTITVKLDPLVEKQFPIDITMTGSIADDAAIKNLSKSMDIVTLVGPKSFVEQTAKVFGVVNLSSNSSSFEMQIPMNAVDEKDVEIPYVHIVPSVITVSVDIASGLKRRIVPVIPALYPAEGWELSETKVEPAQVEISGAESVINSIITINTVPFTVQTGQRVFNGTLKLNVPEGVTVKEDEVKVSASIVRKPVMRDSVSN